MRIGEERKKERKKDKQHIDGGMSKRHRSQTKKFLMAETGNLSNKKHKVVLNYKPDYTIIIHESV